MTPSVLRRALLSLALLAVVAVAGCTSHHAHDDPPPEIVVSVHNVHGDIIDVQALDDLGYVTDLGLVHPDEVVDFVISDYWSGRRLVARCTCDGEVLDTTTAFDGERWAVP